MRQAVLREAEAEARGVLDAEAGAKRKAPEDSTGWDAVEAGSAGEAKGALKRMMDDLREARASKADAEPGSSSGFGALAKQRGQGDWVNYQPPSAVMAQVAARGGGAPGSSAPAAAPPEPAAQPQVRSLPRLPVTPCLPNACPNGPACYTAPACLACSYTCVQRNVYKAYAAQPGVYKYMYACTSIYTYTCGRRRTHKSSRHDPRAWAACHP